MSAKYGRPIHDERFREQPEAVQRAQIPELWHLYATVKYWSRAENGPRTSDGTLSLEELANALVNVLEASWRMGHRNEALRAEAFREMQRRKKK